MEEHGFLVYQLLRQDPQHRRWYISAHQQSPDYWVNDGDGTAMGSEMNAAFLPEQETSLIKDYLVYRLVMHGLVKYLIECSINNIV